MKNISSETQVRGSAGSRSSLTFPAWSARCEVGADIERILLPKCGRDYRVNAILFFTIIAPALSKLVPILSEYFFQSAGAIIVKKRIALTHTAQRWRIEFRIAQLIRQ